MRRNRSRPMNMTLQQFQILFDFENRNKMSFHYSPHEPNKQLTYFCEYVSRRGRKQYCSIRELHRKVFICSSDILQIKPGKRSLQENQSDFFHFHCLQRPRERSPIDNRTNRFYIQVEDWKTLILSAKAVLWSQINSNTDTPFPHTRT